MLTPPLEYLPLLLINRFVWQLTTARIILALKFHLMVKKWFYVIKILKKKEKRERQRDRETERQRDRERDRETERQRDRETERQRERKREREIESNYYGRRKNLVQKLLRFNLFYLDPFNACLSSSRPWQILPNEWQVVCEVLISKWFEEVAINEDIFHQ